MSVEYSHFLIPEDNRFRPAQDMLAGLLEKLFQCGWIDGSELPERGLYLITPTGERGIGFDPHAGGLGSSLEDTCMLYGYAAGKQTALVTETPIDPEDADYELQLHLADDYVYQYSECCESDLEQLAICATCGNRLGYEWDGYGNLLGWTMRIQHRCLRCHSIFDPSHAAVDLANAWTGKKLPAIVGGVAYRFALVIDVGGTLPTTESGEVRIHDELKALCEKALQTNFVERWHFA